MKIDVGIVNFRSYWLLEQQIKHWNSYMKGDFNLVIVDNTPKGERQYKEGWIPLDTDNSFDGISCGEATDFIAHQCKTDIIGLVHPDFFFFDPGILIKVEEQFKQGYKCIGPNGYYPDFARIIDSNPEYSNQHSWKSPTCWGSFFDREFALSRSFICLPPGIGKLCGHEHRERIVTENIPSIAWLGYSPFDDDLDIVFYGPPEKPIGCHMVKGSGGRSHLMQDRLPRAMELGLSKWK